MRRIVIALMASFVWFPAMLKADNYTALWKQWETAVNKDLPQSQIDILNQIITKSTAEKAYGHLVKAQIARGGLTIQISPDSLDAVAAQMAAEEQRAKSPVLRAVYATALGKLYAMQQRGINRKAYQQKSRDCFARPARQDPGQDLRARRGASGYEQGVRRRPAPRCGR